MKKYIILYLENKGDSDICQFQCIASSSKHAIELAYKKISWIIPIKVYLK